MIRKTGKVDNIQVVRTDNDFPWMTRFEEHRAGNLRAHCEDGVMWSCDLDSHTSRHRRRLAH